MPRLQSMVLDWVDVGTKQEIFLSKGKGFHEIFSSCE
jgi:hypothetical protein